MVQQTTASSHSVRKTRRVVRKLPRYVLVLTVAIAPHITFHIMKANIPSHFSELDLHSSKEYSAVADLAHNHSYSEQSALTLVRLYKNKAIDRKNYQLASCYRDLELQLQAEADAEECIGE